MLIHKSHSKNDLINIVKHFNINIINPKKYRKIELSAILSNELHLLEDIVPCEDLCIYNLIDLKIFLNNCNPKKILTIKERNNVIMLCKKIKHYCINYYCIELSEYDNINQIYNDAEYIKNYGDIPSVRKAIFYLMKDPKKLRHIETYISPIIKKELDNKEAYKKINFYKLKIEYKKVEVVFD